MENSLCRSSRSLPLSGQLRRLSALLLVLALASWSSSVKAEETEKDFFGELARGLAELSKAGGYVSSAVSAYDFATKVGGWIGVLKSPLSVDDLSAEVKRIASYQDWQDKQTEIVTIEAWRNYAAGQILKFQDRIANHTFDPTSTETDLWDWNSDQAVDHVLAYSLGNDCTANSIIWQDLSKDEHKLTDYDWRIAQGNRIFRHGVADRICRRKALSQPARSRRA
jgi:hypothetical protein